MKMDDSAVISFLLSTEIIPLCLRIMETGIVIWLLFLAVISKDWFLFRVRAVQNGCNLHCAEDPSR